MLCIFIQPRLIGKKKKKNVSMATFCKIIMLLLACFMIFSKGNVQLIGTKSLFSFIRK